MCTDKEVNTDTVDATLQALMGDAWGKLIMKGPIPRSALLFWQLLQDMHKYE